MAMSSEQAQAAGKKGGHANKGRKQSPEHVAKRLASSRVGLASALVNCPECGSCFQRTSPSQIYCTGRCWTRVNARKRTDWQPHRSQLTTGERRQAYEQLVRENGAECQICKRPEEVLPGRGRGRLSVDHCHVTGKIRGLLCSKCNRGLGMFGDDSMLVRVAADYLLARKE